MSVPPLTATTDPTSLTTLLSLLFEPSPPLHSLLVPTVLSRLSITSTPKTYNELIDTCQDVSGGWSMQEKGEFLSGHPMIGEVKGLSKLSGKEQGGGGATPREVLDRLAHLNQLYCKLYPGLRFITFVNGRSRADIIPEFEATLGLSSSPEDPFLPALESEEAESKIKSPESEEWKKECERGLADVWLIGRARLRGMGLE